MSVSADLDEQEVRLGRERFHPGVGHEPREQGPRLGRLAAALLDLLRVRETGASRGEGGAVHVEGLLHDVEEGASSGCATA